MGVHLAKGTRDFLPETMQHRLQVIGAARKVFARFGFQPIDTPAFERIETLLGKYGEDEKLIFKILKRGRGGESGACDLALRYDLTVPLARMVGMNPQLRMPFKRSHIAPVWRADRPGRGRFREFLQCDVDIIGSTDLLADAECLAVAAAGMRELGFDTFTVRLNDRRILRGVAAAAGALDREQALLVAIDKLDKIGREGVNRELAKRDFEPDQAAAVWRMLETGADDDATLDRMATALADIEPAEVRDAALAGVQSLRELLPLLQALGVPADAYAIDPTLARGLDYYTGMVFEITVPGFSGSMGGGGRYDHLIKSLGGPDLPAVGGSLGLDRILAVLAEQGQLGRGTDATEILVTVFDDAHRTASLKAAHALRSEGLRVAVYSKPDKLKKQFKYADALGVPWLVVIGPDEAAAGRLTLRDLRSGQQHHLNASEVPGLVRA